MKFNFAVAALALSALLATSGRAATLYSENFDVDSSANWVLNGGPADESANFFFDYSTAGIPAAPNSGGTTRGMNLQANASSAIFGGASASPIGQSFSGDYVVKFDWWENVNGGFPGGGSGSTQLGTFGIGTAGATAQWPGGVQDSVWFAATGDGNSSADWRAYSEAAQTGYLEASGVFAAGTGATARNHNDPYYASFGNVTAPAAQLALFPQQTGSTLAGSAGMEWHEVEIATIADIVTWKVDGVLIATVDSSAMTLDGNIFFGHSDTNATSSSDVNDTKLLFTLIDNVRVESIIPEPASVALLGIAGIGLVSAARRRR